MNVTSIGSTYDKFEKTLREKFLEMKQFHKDLPIKVSEKDIQFANKRILLKTIMMKVDEDQLIECATQVETNNLISIQKTQKIEINPTVIAKIKKYYEEKKKNENTGQAVITKFLRSQNVEKFVKEFNNETLMKSLETEIYVLTKNSFADYTSKINDILFIFKNYPNFKNFLLQSKISINQLALFEKELAFEALVNITTIKNRRSVIKQIKQILLEKGIYKNRLLNNYKCNVVAKRLELLVLDISVNEKNYDTLVNKLLKYIEQNVNIFQLNLEDIILAITSKQEFPSQDYSKLNINDIKAIMSQIKLDIDNFLENKKAVEKDILNWKCPLRVLKVDREKWEQTLKTGKINEIGNFRKFLLKKYDLPEDYRLVELRKKISVANDKYSDLKEYYNLLKQKQEKVSPDMVDYVPQIEYKPITFERDNVMINELIQLYKRKLMIDSLKLNKNKLIELFELIDINDLLFKNSILQKRLLVDISNLLPSGYNYFDFNQYYYTASLEAIKPYLNENSITFTNNESGLKDYYGNDIFNKLYNTSSPQQMYKSSIEKEYYSLNETSKIQVVPEYRRLRILYNPYTGKFGKEAQDGYVFEVEKLRKGQDGQPIEDFVMHESIDPRTNQMVYKRIKVPIQGNDPFIKIPILTSKADEPKFTWVSVKKEQTVMLAGNHDTCSRFDNNQKECSTAKGLGNSSCVFNEETKKCKADYNTKFGRSKNFKKSKKFKNSKKSKNFKNSKKSKKK